jgi:hypothetical protein
MSELLEFGIEWLLMIVEMCFGISKQKRRRPTEKWVTR